jgi:uncharacterized protein (TIGR02391 family)
MANYKVVAYQIGDLIKYSSTVNEINRAALSVCSFNCQDFPNFRNAITSERAYCYLCWVFSIANQKHLPIWDRNKKLISFTNLLLTTDQQEQANKIFVTAGILNESHEFDNRDYHKAIIDNSRKLFIETNYFHAVFEAAKCYNKEVQRRSGSSKDGSQLMMDVFGDKGVLRHNEGKTPTEIDELNGIKFMSAGLMQALRNPTAHELAIEWRISKKDCLDILSFISFLLRKLDECAVQH